MDGEAGAMAGGDAGAAAAGSAADLLGGSGGMPDIPAGTSPQAGTGGEPGGDGGDAGGSGADPDWYNQLSAEGGDGDNPSIRDWVKATGVRDLDGLAKVARDNQKALRESGRIKVPGEGATPEEISAFNKAIGVPDAPTDYTFTAPKDADGNDLPLNAPLIERLQGAAHKAGLPKAGFEAVVQDFIQAQLDEQSTFDREQQSLAQGKVKEWGSEANAKLAAIDTAARALGLNSDQLVAMRNALGADFALDMMSKLGSGMSEDTMILGGRQRFGTSGQEAQAEMDRLKTDTDFQKKLMSGDTASTARWNRLQDAAAAWKAQQPEAA
jgi:hypothetical protein